MSCYACGEGFGLFSKEHGCKNCGFAFCSKCLPKKIAIPKLNNEKHRACMKCYGILSGKVKETAPTAKYSPPENFKKRVAALKEREANKSQHPQHSNAASGHTVKPQYRGLSKAEREIAERLDKLKEKTPEEAAKSNISQKQIEDRLSKLKGEEPSSQPAQQRKYYQPPDRRSQQAQIDDLLDEIADEVELDSRLPDPVTQIENRLSRLKGEEPSGSASNNNDLSSDQAASAKPFTQNISAGDKGNNSGGTDDKITLEEMQKLIAQAAQEVEMDAQKAMVDLQKDKEIMKRLQEIKSRKKDDINKDHGNTEGNDESDSDNEDEEKLTKNLLKQLLEESRLEDAAIRNEVKEDNINSPDQTIDPDELPYCSICTEDATIRCHSCELDLFCRRCWNHCHKEFGMEDHDTSKYVMPKETK